MSNTNLQDYSHKRFNILTGEWVLVSPQRAKRPWQGQNEEVNNEKRPTHDESCYLCAGNTRINGEVTQSIKMCLFLQTILLLYKMIRQLFNEPIPFQ